MFAFPFFRKKDAFSEKVKMLSRFHIPLLQELEKAEKNTLHPRLQQGTVHAFLKELDSIIRWTKQEEVIVAGEKQMVHVAQASKNLRENETDLDHVIAMEQMAHVLFTSQMYQSLQKEFNEEKVKNGIFVHDGGEIGVGDTTHADEAYWLENKIERKAKEHYAFTNFFRLRTKLKGLGERTAQDLYDSYFDEEFGLTKEGEMVVFLDHLQAIAYGIKNIYPYEKVYQTRESLSYYLETYLAAPAKNLSIKLPSNAQEELKQFVAPYVNQQIIERSYTEAIAEKRLTEKMGNILLQTALKSSAL